MRSLSHLRGWMLATAAYLLVGYLVAQFLYRQVVRLLLRVLSAL